MGHAHVHRPFVSRREFLRRSAVVGAAAAATPFFWRQLAYAADAPVTQLHLTFGRDAAREMAVSWMTAAPVAGPFAEVDGHRVAARTVQYRGYPGFFHHASLDGLSPSTRYAYRVGHADAVRSGPSAFTTGPDRRRPFTFTAFGDQGTDDGGLAQPPNQPSRNTDLARSFNPAFHLIVGDLAYANGNQAIWDDWFSMVEPMAQATPWMPLLGNHEIESQLSGGTGSGWGKWGYDPYRTRFDLPSNGHDDLANCFYGFRYGSVHFLCLDNNDVNDEIKPNIGYTGGRQRAWVEQELAAARLDPDVDFIVVGMHQCAFSSSTKHGVDPGVQAAWFELFHRYSVDLVLQGHDHTYERSHAMHGDKVADDGPVYRADVGTVYVVCGNGGAVQEPFEPVQPGWSAFRQALKVGTLKIEVDPDAPGGKSQLTLGEYWALDGSPIEEGIVIERTRTQAASVPSSEMGSPAVAQPGRNTATVSAGTASAGAPRPDPDPILPATGGPAGIGLVGVGAAAGGLALRALNREARKAELEEQGLG